MRYVIQHAGFGVFMGWDDEGGEYKPRFSVKAKLTEALMHATPEQAQTTIKKLPRRYAKAYISPIPDKATAQPRFIIDPVMKSDTVEEELVHHWTINVAKRDASRGMPGQYVHFFRTGPISGMPEEVAGVYAKLVDAFPAPEWSVTLSAHVEYGIQVKPRRLT